MANLNDVIRIAAKFLGSECRDDGQQRRWSVNDHDFAWERPLGKKDRAFMGEHAPTGEVVALHTTNLNRKDALLEGGPRAVFTTPHFDGYPAILLDLNQIALRDLQALLLEAWHVAQSKPSKKQKRQRPRAKTLG